MGQGKERKVVTQQLKPFPVSQGRNFNCNAVIGCYNTFVNKTRDKTQILYLKTSVELPKKRYIHLVIIDS